MKVGYQACRAGWRWWMQADLVPSGQKFSSKWNLSFFNSVPSNRLYIISFLLSLFCLFQNAILHKILKVGFWNFKHIFLRIQFSLVATLFFSSFGYKFELICWYFHLIISYLILVTWTHLKGHQVIGLDLSTSPKSAVKWIILKSY